MYPTVTANTSLDRIVFLEEFIPGKTMPTGNYLDLVGEGWTSPWYNISSTWMGRAPWHIAGDNGKLLNLLLDRPAFKVN